MSVHRGLYSYSSSSSSSSLNPYSTEILLNALSACSIALNSNPVRISLISTRKLKIYLWLLVTKRHRSEATFVLFWQCWCFGTFQKLTTTKKMSSLSFALMSPLILLKNAIIFPMYYAINRSYTHEYPYCRDRDSVWFYISKQVADMIFETVGWC